MIASPVFHLFENEALIALHPHTLVGNLIGKVSRYDHHTIAVAHEHVARKYRGITAGDRYESTANSIAGGMRSWACCSFGRMSGARAFISTDCDA